MTTLKEWEGMEDRVGAHMDDALAFVPSGANLLEAVRGELNGDGIEYQLLVIDQPTPEGLVAASAGAAPTGSAMRPRTRPAGLTG